MISSETVTILWGRGQIKCAKSQLQSPRVGPQSTPVVIDGHIDLKRVTERCYMSPSANSIILGEL